MKTNEKNRRWNLCIEKQKKLSVCVYSSPQTPRKTFSVVSLLARRFSMCVRRNAEKIHVRDEKIFYCCCGLLQAHQQRLHLHFWLCTKILCTMDAHRFFSRIFFGRLSENKNCEKLFIEVSCIWLVLLLFHWSNSQKKITNQFCGAISQRFSNCLLGIFLKIQRKFWLNFCCRQIILK